MKYVPPKVLAVHAAIVKLEGLGKVIGTPPESVGPPPRHTIPAYEADE